MNAAKFFLLCFGFVFSSLSYGGVGEGAKASLLCRCEQPYRAVGMNYFDGIYRRIRHPMDESYVAGLDILKKYNVPFVRISMTGHWPAEFKRYVNQPEIYFRIVDDFLSAAEKRNIGVVASVMWNYAAIPDAVGERMSAWGDANSKTSRLADKLTRELVSRYKGRDVIWAWEFGNEMMLRADLPNAEKFRPAINVEQGTPKLRVASDDLTSIAILAAYHRFAETVKSIDPNVMLSTGNAVPRPFAFNNTKHKSWKRDSKEEFCNVLSRDNPSPYDLPSIHVYSDSAGYFGVGAGYADAVRQAAACMKSKGKPLFVGEFGIGRERGRSEAQERRLFEQMLDDIMSASVELSAVWVFDFPFHRGTYNIYAGERQYQLEILSDANKAIARELKLSSSCHERPRKCGVAVRAGR